MRENDDCDEHEAIVTDKQQETNAIKSEKETNLKSDISGSRDILIRGQNDQHNLPKTADFNLEEDFLETASLDCSSLSGYVENALLASANNTLDRGTKLSAFSLDSDKGEVDFSGSGSESEGRKSSLCVQYVTYDFIAAKSVSGLSSDGSSECFNSNESLNDQRKSEREEFVNSLLSKQNTNTNNNNSTLERYSNTSAAVEFTNTEQESGSNLKEPEATTFKTSDKHSSETSLTADDSVVKNFVDSTDGNPIVHLQHCPLSSENEDDDQDMKAKKFLGLCLCQTAEVTDDESATELDFRNCNLKQVPIEIFQFTNTLQHLQLDSNTLSELPKALFSCTQLEYLTVSDNDLANLPSGLAGLTSLSYLDISKNVIEDVPDCIRCCKSLEVLDASVNPIERLSEGFTQLVGLKELYLNDCFLEFLPASFGRLIHLSVLELRDNQLQILPKSIKRLTMLKRLDLGGNVFQEWPDVISQLLKLNELWLDGNELNDVPPELGDLSNLVYLDISRNFVESIPSRLGSLTQLSDLLLCENHISKLPDTIGFLEKLNMLKCSMNQLTEIPNSVGKLHEIEELDLSHNKLETIPASIGNLKKMHTCLLDNNVLDSIPPEIGSCSKLKILQLSRNNLSSIPSKVGDLSELRVLNVCRNKLPHLPISVIKLAKLEALWVSSNQSKPNVPLHAEIAPNSKVRILTNILFPQTEEKPTIKMDEDGYAIDVADDNMSDVKKIRGVTRVAFNLELDIKEENNDEAMDHGTHVDVSANHIDDVTTVTKKPSILTVKIMPENDKDESTEIATPTTPTKQHFHKHEEPKDDLELLHLRGPKISHHNEEKPSTNSLLESEENLRKPKPKEKPSLPLLPPNSGVKLSVGDSPDGEPPQIPKIKTWSSRNNLPSAITDNNPDGNKSEENKLGDDIHFMDSDDNDAFDVRQSSNNNNKVLENSSNIRIDNSGNTRDWDARNVVSIPEDNKPHSNNNQENDGPCPDWDSGVGNDVDSQESIPECPDEVESLPSSPASSNTATKPSSSTVSKPVSHPVVEKPKISPKKLPVPSQSSITPADKKSSGSVFENIKKFETYTNKENQSKSANQNTNVTPTSVNQNRKTPEEKAVIRPNNHLSKQPLKNSAFDNAKSEPVKHFEKKSDVLIKETNPNEVMFSSEDNADLFTFSKIEQTDKTNKKQPESKRKLPDAPPQESKHQIFRDRLEKIMQQQRNVAMQASQATQNISQSEMIMTYSRKSSLSAISGNEADPDAKGLENLTAETSFPDDEQAPASPTKKGPPVYERMKNRLSERKPSQAPSSKIISRSRPGSAPATQLQRRGSSQRSSISALEGEDKRTLSALGTNDNKNNLNQRARSKSIEQQLGQLLLTDSDDAKEELASHHRARNDRHDPRNDDRLRTNMLSNSAKFGVSGSRSSLVSPPPVRHNMYAKQRSSTNPPPVSDWKYKLLQHIERKRQEKTEVETRDNRYMNRQSIGKIKSPPKTNVPHHHQQAHYDHDNRYYSSNYDNQPIYADPYKRGMSNSVTAPAIGHQPKPSQPLPRSHSSSSSNKPNHIKPPKHRTFTPGPEHSSAFNEAVVQPQVSRPKSAMEKYSPSVGHVDPHFHNPNNDLPSYKDHLERHKAREAHQIIPRHLESEIRQPQQKFNGGFPLRPTGSHDSLMDNYSRYDKPAQPTNYYHDNPIRTTNSHDSILDQVGQSNYYDPYQEQHHLLPTKLQYRAPPTVPTQQQQYHVPPQYKPAQYTSQVPHHKPSKPKHQEYSSPDHATYVNVMSYQQQQSPSGGIPHHHHNHGNPHGHGKTPPSYNQYKQHHNQYYNKPLPAEPPTYNPVPNYRNPPQPQPHQRHNHQYAAGKEIHSQTHVIYKEEESVASAFRPYNQGKPLIPRQPPSYQPPPPIEQSRHRQHHRTPSGGPHSYSNYMETQNNRRQSPPLQQQHSWENEYEMITVSIRRNPTFGFHVMGGVGAGGNPYTANDDGVFITHVTPGGPAEGKLQPGDKIILVNGSKFVGISHTRAVDMLRNAGHAAVLVVERSLGKAV